MATNTWDRGLKAVVNTDPFFLMQRVSMRHPIPDATTHSEIAANKSTESRILDQREESK